MAEHTFRVTASTRLSMAVMAKSLESVSRPVKLHPMERQIRISVKEATHGRAGESSRFRKRNVFFRSISKHKMISARLTAINPHLSPQAESSNRSSMANDIQIRERQSQIHLPVLVR